MPKKIALIEFCDECPNFDNEYYSYESLCTKLDRTIPWPENKTGVPDDCPLKDWEEE